jgi:hypothetical protein
MERKIAINQVDLSEAIFCQTQPVSAVLRLFQTPKNPNLQPELKTEPKSSPVKNRGSTAKNRRTSKSK